MKRLIKKLKSKLKKNKGFTLAELLFSMIILMLSTTIILQCFNLGLSNVIRETRSSEAQLLCSALTSSLQNELTYARDIKVDNSSKVLKTYFSSSRRMGANSTIKLDQGKVIISNGVDADYPLVDRSNYTAKNRGGVAGNDDDSYFLKAFWDGGIKWNETNQVFEVTIWVDDATKAAITDATVAKKQALAYSHFVVKPLAGVVLE